LNKLVTDSPTYAAASHDGSVLVLPTGDGMAMLFTADLAAPARCAIDIARGVRGMPFRLRMGIHSGVIQRQLDIMGNPNVAGEGINIAQRVMDVADEGHILLSDQYARWLVQFDEWRPYVTELGEAVAKHGVKLSVSNLASEDFGNRARPSKVGASAASAPATPTQAVPAAAAKDQKHIVILYRRHAEPDAQVVALIEEHFKGLGHDVFIDRHLRIGVEWAQAIEERIRAADAVVPVVSDASVGSEMMEYEVETALAGRQANGKPSIYPVRVGGVEPIGGALGALLNSLQFVPWVSQADDAQVVEALTTAMQGPVVPLELDHLEPVGGAVQADSPFYIERRSDGECMQALRNHESVILVKGPRQIGKTSLIARGLAEAEKQGWKTIITDFQKFGSSQLADEERFYRTLAASVAKQLGFKYDWENEWIDAFGANMNMDSFIRAALEESDQHVVWFMDEADRIFGIPFATDFFGLVRSWHNARAIEPRGPWKKLTLVIGYATEAHLFIQDLNQSPFNIGLQLPLQPFDLDQTRELNRLYHQPLKSGPEVEQLHSLVAGQPFLTRRALDVLARGRMDFPTLLATADRDDGPFGDHLKRILLSVSQMPEVLEAMRRSLTNADLRDTEGFYRLMAAGVMMLTHDNKVAFRNELYRRYLEQHL
jgi:hypothetical protein